MILKEALTLAQEYLEYLSPACERIEIVGSCKRQDKPEVKDIEFLLIPKNERPVPEFGKPNQIYQTKLEKVIADLEYADKIRQASNKSDGDRHKRRAIKGFVNEFCIELFIVKPGTWALQNVIRTGPSLFSHRFVANRNQKILDRDSGKTYPGLLPIDLTYVKRTPNNAGGQESHITRNGLKLELHEEQDAIALLGQGWIPPNERRLWATGILK